MQLRDHGVIGDRGRTALVDTTGAIDFYAPDGIDAPPSCWSLVDARSGGAVRLGPTNPAWTGTQQVPHDEAPTLVTTFETPDGAFSVEDHLCESRIIRVLTVLRGSADVLLAVQPGDGLGPARRVDRWSEGVAYGAVIVQGMETDVPQTLHAGDRRVVTVSARRDRGITRSAPDLSQPSLGEALREREDLVSRWRREVGAADADIAHRSALLRSVRALRLLTTQGAVLRTLTTSLPPQIGNDRNTDERHAWLRDSADATVLWERLGLRDWADESRRWLHERAGDDLPLAPLYRPDGDRPHAETDLGLPGWRGNGPVRAGNSAGALLDLGAIAAVGAVLDDRSSRPHLERLGDWLAEHTPTADTGRWDERSRPRLHVDSVLAARAALIALVRTARRRNPIDPVTLEWTDAIRELDEWLRVEGRFGSGGSAGWRRSGGSLADDSTDASLLAWIGGSSAVARVEGALTLRDDAEGERALRDRNTVELSLSQLSQGPFMHRHLAHVDDGFPPGQGADLWASFTMVSALCGIGRWEEAHSRFEALLTVLGPTHVGATHVDPSSGDLRGNLLAAPSHLALIDAALALGSGPR